MLKRLKSPSFHEPGLLKTDKNRWLHIIYVFYTIVGSHFHAPLEMSLRLVMFDFFMSCSLCVMEQSSRFNYQ